MSRENAAGRIRIYNPHLSDARSQPYGLHIARIPVSSARRSPREQGKRLDGAPYIEPVKRLPERGRRRSGRSLATAVLDVDLVRVSDRLGRGL
jgi:hypothetical protein